MSWVVVLEIVFHNELPLSNVCEGQIQVGSMVMVYTYAPYPYDAMYWQVGSNFFTMTMLEL